MRRNGRWARCACVQAALAATFILSSLRGTETSYDPVWDARDPLPRIPAITILTGDARAFRHYVWRSLLAYEPEGITYDVLNVDQLSEMRFQNAAAELTESQLATGYRSLREIFNLDILILRISEFQFRNPMVTSLFGRALEERELAGRATWIHTPLVGSKLSSVFDFAFVDRWFSSVHRLDADAPAASLHLPTRSDGSRVIAQGQSPYALPGGGSGGH